MTISRKRGADDRGGFQARFTPPVLIGALWLAIALTAMAGWLMRDEGILRLLTTPPMAFNTALCFALAAIAFMCDAAAPRLRARLQASLGTVIMVAGSAVLAQYLSGVDLGIDWKPLHEWFPDPRRESGRMSLAASIAFIVTGINFIAMHHLRGTAAAYGVRGLAAAVVAIGIFTFLSRALGLEALFAGYLFQLVSLSTATGFVVTGILQWLAWRQRAPLALAEDDRIVLVGIAATLLIGAAIGVGSLTALKKSTEDALGKSLLLATSSRATLFTTIIDNRIAAAEAVGARPEVVRLFELLRHYPDDAEIRLTLLRRANREVGNGFSLVEFRDLQGAVLAAAVSVPADATLLFPIRRPYNAKLLWHKAPVLHLELPILLDGNTLGTLIVQRPMPELTERVLDVQTFGKTGELLICGADERLLRCLPARSSVRPLDIPRRAAGAPLPVERGLAGETGLMDSFDYRNRRVMAAYAPAGDLALGVSLKMETEELFAPLARRFAYVLPLMLALLAGGALILRAAVKPLAQRLRTSEERLTLALEGSRLALWDWDIVKAEIYFSKEWQEMLGAAPEPIVTSLAALEERVHPDDLPRLSQHLKDVLQDAARQYDIEHRVRTEPGSWIWILSRGKVVERDRAGRALRLTGTSVDVSERKQTELQLAHQATHDALTGLPSRGLFYDRLQQAMGRSRRNRTLMAALYLDIDNFKQFNDRLGHAAGDAVLREFARRLAGSVRSIDTIARLAGDEFAVILQELATRDDACRIAEKILATMRPPFALAAGSTDVGTSIGIAFYDGEDPADTDRLLAWADQALYAAKSAGRGMYHVAS